VHRIGYGAFRLFAFGRSVDYAALTTIGWLHAKRMDQTARIFFYQRGRRSVSRDRLFTARREHVCEDAQRNQLQTNEGIKMKSLQLAAIGSVKQSRKRCTPTIGTQVEHFIQGRGY
jgi:hypothetical protein